VQSLDGQEKRRATYTKCWRIIRGDKPSALLLLVNQAPLDFSRSRYGQSYRSISRRVEDRHLLKAIGAFVSRRSPTSG